MSLRNRITQYVQSVLSTRIRCTQGGILLGRKTSGPGYAQEITLGTGLELSAEKVLSATATGSVSDVAYDATSWNGVTDVAPSKNAVRDKIAAMDASIAASQPLNADLTAYANAADADARQVLINAAARPLTRTAAEGAPGGTVDATHVGQICRVGDDPYTWYRALTAGTGTSTWEEVVGSTDAILGKLQGAAEDPTKIGEEYMPPVIPSIIELADPAPDTPASNQLTGGEDASLIYFGGKPYQPLPRGTQVGAKTFPYTRIARPVKYTWGIGQVTTAGNLSVQVTSAAHSLNETVSVPVLEGDRPEDWIPKVAAAINANANIAAHYNTYGIGANYRMQEVTSTTTDVVFTFSNGTAAGTSVGTASTSTQYAMIEICRFKIYSDECVDEQTFMLTGDLNLSAAAYTNAKTVTLALMPASGITNGLSQHQKPTYCTLTQKADFGFLSKIKMLLPCKYDTSGSNLVFTAAGASTITSPQGTEIVQKADNTVEAIKSLNFVAPSSACARIPYTPPVGDPAYGDEIILVAFCQIDTAIASGSITASYNLTLVPDAW